MLILLLGPSGVGKSSIAQHLVEQSGWLPLISIITRAERADEIFKVSISTRSYEMLASHRKLWSDVEQNGYRYGLLKNEVQAAVEDPKHFYVVDFGLSSRNTFFSDVDHLVVYIAAENDAALKSRIIAAQRPDRVAGALATSKELDAWYESTGVREGVKKIINFDGLLTDVAAQVIRAANIWASQRQRSG